jgi:phosphoribosylformylglycinamidine synthase
MVQTNTVVGPGSDAAVLRIKGTGKALAMVLDGPAVHVARDPREGARRAVAEACRNLVCSGATPLAVTNCLNFGNPEHPEVMWQFSEVVDGMAEACLRFGTPVTGGNVSFYNETFEEDIYPTPVIGMVGLIEDLGHVMRASFRSDGDRILLIEPGTRSEKVDLDEELALQRLVLELIRSGLLRSAHDLAEGGFAVALAESCFSTIDRSAIGAEIDVPSSMEVVADFFGELPTRVLVSAADPAPVGARARAHGFVAHDVGRVGGDRLIFAYEGARAIDIDVEEAEQVWRRGLSALMENR